MKDLNRKNGAHLRDWMIKEHAHLSTALIQSHIHQQISSTYFCQITAGETLKGLLFYTWGQRLMNTEL